MKAREVTLSITLLLVIVCCAHSKEIVEEQDAASASDSVHLAKKRSAAAEGPGDVADVLLDSYSPYLSAPADDEKRSSLFRFGKRQGSLFRFGKRQGSLFRFGKRQGSLFRYGKRAGGGTLFRFGRSGGALPETYGDHEEALREMLAAYLARQAELQASTDMMAKRQELGFHWGSDE